MGFFFLGGLPKILFPFQGNREGPGRMRHVFFIHVLGFPGGKPAIFFGDSLSGLRSRHF